MGENGELTGSLTCADLDEKARATAGHLQELGLAGERVLLLLQPSLEYLVAYLGCLYAGAIAVPAYPPDEARLERSLPRAQAIIRSAAVRAVFADASLLAKRAQLAEMVPELEGMLWLRATLDVLPGPWEMPAIEPSSLAFLQFTSGSTGEPKGVRISHGNLLHNVWAMHRRMQLGPDSRMVSWVPPYHDMGLVVGTMLPLYAGFPTYLMAPATFVRSPFRWLEAISRYRATTSCAPNFAFELCVRKISVEQRSRLDLSSWTLALNGAEPVRQSTIESFSQAFHDQGFRASTFYPAFGMSDATAMVSGGPPERTPPVFLADPAALAQGLARHHPAGRPLVSCGPSIEGQDAVVVDPKTRRPLPAGQVGEFWLHGPCVGHGYWGRPEETTEVYEARLEDPADPRRFLRTGDLGFLHEDELYLTGRLKDLIIIRGKNHYPQDIESTVQQAHKAMRPGCGIAFSVELNDEERLVVVQELDERHVEAPGDALETALRAIVAEHEVFPQSLLLVAPGTIPKTSSGKLQRSACRDLFLRGALRPIQEHRAEAALNNHPLSATSLIPAGERERLLGYPRPQQVRLLRVALLGQLSVVLRIDPLQIHADRPLSRLGFDSLVAIELKNRLEVLYRVSIPMTSLLRGATIVSLSEYIADQLALEGTSLEPVGETSLATFPLSYGQQALWFLQQLAPQSAAYNVVLPILLRGPLDTQRLRACFDVLVERHGLLRAVFTTHQGEPQQTLLDSAPAAFEVVDGQGWSDDDVREFLTRESCRPFDLTALPLFRVCLVRSAPDRHHMLLTAHHIVIDFWSMGVLFHELGKLYTHPEAPRPELLPALALDYSQYVAWQQRWLRSPEGAQQETYWRSLLEGELPVLELPTDHPRPPTQTFRGAARGFKLSAAQTSALKEVAAAHQVTPFVLLLAAFELFLHQHTGQQDLLIGTLTAGRTKAQFADLVGYFVNPVLIRATLSNEPFSEHLNRVRTRVLDALSHQEYPFSRLVERLLASRDPSRSPLFQVLFVLQRAPSLDERELTPFALAETEAHMRLGELDLESIALNQRQSRFDLTLTMADGPTGLAGSFEYSSDLFAPATIDRMIERFVVLLDALGQRPGSTTLELQLLPERERAELARGWLATARPLPTTTVVDQFAAQAARIPTAIALIHEDQALTYRQLDERSSQLAHALRARGAGPETLVGLCVDRGIDLVVGILGVLKAGAAYLPLDPSYPHERLAFMLADAAAPLLLAHEDRAIALGADRTALCFDRDAALLAAQPTTRPEVTLAPEHLAYVLYTSGSTGRPKGVMIEHRALLNFLASMVERPGFGPQDVLLSVTSPSFDIFGLELFLPLVNGARLVLASRGDTLDGAQLLRLAQRHDVTVMQATPSTWRLMVDSDVPRWPPLRALCGGEPLPPSLAQALLDRGVQLWNMYGPTETTIWSTCQHVTDPAHLTLGLPIANTSVYVLDPHLNLVPTGVWGEFYIGGVGVARGYLRREELTAERFPTDPFASTPGARMYRTGDRVRRLPGGEYEFSGRVDFQVKVRGHRIELGEIEARLQAIQGVHQAIVHLQEPSPGNQQLVGYVVPAASVELQPRALQEQLRAQLPEYMVPRYFVTLEGLPLTPNGKVNRKALPVPRLLPDSDMPVSRRAFTETRLARLWSSLLGLKGISNTDNFFELGGHSLLVIRLIALCRQEFGVDCPVAAVFNAPTLEKMSRLIEQLSRHQPLELGDLAGQMEADVALDETIAPRGLPLATSRDVFFTGGTGFLGGFLLRELLDRQDGQVLCLVRAPDADAARARLRQNLERFRLSRPGDDERIVPVVGDLAQPRLGLSEADYQQLAQRAGWILHNGAIVDFVRPYAQLREANIEGTRQIFRLATEETLKPVHFVSTVSVFPPQPTGPRRHELESDPLTFDGSQIHGGYAQSKWVSDRIALIARARKIPVTIYRPGSILGAGATGMGNVDDIFHIIVKGCIQLGMVPEVDMWANFTPTDFVAPAIVAMALEPAVVNGSYHLVNPQPVPWSRLCAQMVALGYVVREVPYKQWLEAIETAAQQGADVALVRVLPFFQVPAETFRLPWFDDREARPWLDLRGLVCPPANDQFLATWLSHLIRSGFLPPP